MQHAHSNLPFTKSLDPPLLLHTKLTFRPALIFRHSHTFTPVTHTFKLLLHMFDIGNHQ